MKTTQELKELLYKNKTVADQQPDAIAEANAFCEGYKAFLNAAKTEREAAIYAEKAAIENGIAEKLDLQRMVLPVKDCRSIGKKDMRFNDRTGDIRVDPETYSVTVDGEPITCKAAESLPLTQRYFLF